MRAVQVGCCAVLCCVCIPTGLLGLLSSSSVTLAGLVSVSGQGLSVGLPTVPSGRFRGSAHFARCCRSASRPVPIKVQDRPCPGTLSAHSFLFFLPQVQPSRSSPVRHFHAEVVIVVVVVVVVVGRRARSCSTSLAPSVRRHLDISTSPPSASASVTVSPCYGEQQARQERATSAFRPLVPSRLCHGRAPAVAVHAPAREAIFACSRLEKRRPSSASSRPLSPASQVPETSTPLRPS